MNQHDVTGANLHVLPLQGASKVGSGDLVTRLQLGNTLVAGHIDEHTAGEQRPNVFDTQLCQPFGLSKVGAIVAVIEEVADTKMAKSVELGSDLAKFTAENLVMVNSLIAPWNLERLRYAKAVMPCPKHRHSGLIGAPNLVNVSSSDEILRFQDLGGRDPIGRTTLVISPPT